MLPERAVRIIRACFDSRNPVHLKTVVSCIGRARRLVSASLDSFNVFAIPRLGQEYWSCSSVATQDIRMPSPCVLRGVREGLGRFRGCGGAVLVLLVVKRSDSRTVIYIHTSFKHCGCDRSYEFFYFPKSILANSKYRLCLMHASTRNSIRLINSAPADLAALEFDSEPIRIIFPSEGTFLVF
jgi:hypothetical protein